MYHVLLLLLFTTIIIPSQSYTFFIFLSFQISAQSSAILTEVFLVFSVLSRLGGVVVSVLATGPKVCGFEPGQGDGFLRAIKIRSTLSSRMGGKAGKPHIS
jgi:hypothetical protein